MLSPKQEKFCLEYMKLGHGKANEAYVAAGFKPNKKSSRMSAASRLLKNPEIQARLRELSQEMVKANIADVVECQSKLTEIIRDDGVKAFARIKAIEILLRTHGAFETNINVTSAIPVVISGGDLLEE